MKSEISAEYNKVLRQFKAKYKNIKPALEYARRIIEQHIDRNFDSGGRWNGSSLTFFSGGNQKWKPLASSTKAKYKKLGYELVTTLNRSNGLRSTIGTQVIGNNAIMITANSPYSRIHQLGGDINHPGGTPYINLASGLARFISNKKANQLENKGHKVKRTKAHRIRIPARPFITITPDELKNLVDYISRFGIR